jgi:hypothetical protein
MRKLFIALSFVLCSCTNDFMEDFHDRQEIEISEIRKGCEIGIQVITLSSWCAELHVSESMIDRIEDNSDDIDAIIDAIAELQEQEPYFSDVIVGSEIWDRWCEWYADNNI